ncbi:hypothetical protein ACJIZ3_008833 [Penstemon smallii]|uniref:Uncharacterized protein n=1 Tax=Penstemon smallii TaxID=265156 RepID=A0ABD3TCQ6_9LAMI
MMKLVFGLREVEPYGILDIVDNNFHFLFDCVIYRMPYIKI